MMEVMTKSLVAVGLLLVVAVGCPATTTRGTGGADGGVQSLDLTGKLAIFFHTSTPSELAQWGGDFGTKHDQTAVGYVPELSFFGVIASRTETDSDSPWSFHKSDFSVTTIYPLTVGRDLFVVAHHADYSSGVNSYDIVKYAYSPSKRRWVMLGAVATGLPANWTIMDNTVYWLDYTAPNYKLVSKMIGADTTTTVTLSKYPGRLFAANNTLVGYIPTGNTLYAAGFYKISTTGAVSVATAKVPSQSYAPVYAGDGGIYWSSFAAFGSYTAIAVSRLDPSTGAMLSHTISLDAAKDLRAVHIDDHSETVLVSLVENAGNGATQVKSVYQLPSEMTSDTLLETIPFGVANTLDPNVQVVVDPSHI